MEKVISVLQFILKIATNISDLIFKLPVWVIKLIPGGKKLLESLEGYRTVAANFSVAAIAFMEGKDWLEIGDSVCAFVNMVLGIFKLNYVCDQQAHGCRAAAAHCPDDEANHTPDENIDTGDDQKLPVGIRCGVGHRTAVRR